MTADELTQWGQLFTFIEKYGITQVFLVAAIAALWYMIRKIVKGDFVPRWMFEKSEADRERLLAILENQETGALKEVLDFMKKIKVKEDGGG